MLRADVEPCCGHMCSGGTAVCAPLTACCGYDVTAGGHGVGHQRWERWAGRGTCITCVRVHVCSWFCVVRQPVMAVTDSLVAYCCCIAPCADYVNDNSSKPGRSRVASTGTGTGTGTGTSSGTSSGTASLRRGGLAKSASGRPRKAPPIPTSLGPRGPASVLKRKSSKGKKAPGPGGRRSRKYQAFAPPHDISPYESAFSVLWGQFSGVFFVKIS